MRELKVFDNMQRQREDEIRASQDEADVETFLPSVQECKFIFLTHFSRVFVKNKTNTTLSPNGNNGMHI